MKVGGKHVLVTGAGGFVGSHLVERLVRENCRVRCLIEYDSRGDVGWLEDLTPKATESIEVVAGDLRDAVGSFDDTRPMPALPAPPDADEGVGVGVDTVA